MLQLFLFPSVKGSPSIFPPALRDLYLHRLLRRYTCLERFSGFADFDASVVRQGRVVGRDVHVFDVFSDRRVVMAHVGQQYRVIFSHGHSANTRYSAGRSRAPPVPHLNLRDLDIQRACKKASSLDIAPLTILNSGTLQPRKWQLTGND